MTLDELKVYELSMDIAEEVWSIVNKWDYFAKDTVGKQLVRAIDSVAANLSEGFGRYHYREKRNFGFYSRGSLYETKTWITKAKNRGLIKPDDFERFKKTLNHIAKMLNGYINSFGKYDKSNDTVNEPPEDYF